MNPSNGVTSPTRSTGWGGEGRRIGEEKGGGEGGGERRRRWEWWMGRNNDQLPKRSGLEIESRVGYAGSYI